MKYALIIIAIVFLAYISGVFKSRVPDITPLSFLNDTIVNGSAIEYHYLYVIENYHKYLQLDKTAKRLLCERIGQNENKLVRYSFTFFKQSKKTNFDYLWMYPKTIFRYSNPEDIIASYNFSNYGKQNMMSKSSYKGSIRKDYWINVQCQ